MRTQLHAVQATVFVAGLAVRDRVHNARDLRQRCTGRSLLRRWPVEPGGRDQSASRRQSLNWS